VSAIVNASFAGCFGAIIVGQGLQLLAQLKDAPRGDTPRVSMTDEPPPQWRLDCDPRFAVLSEKDHAPCKDAAGRILRRSTYMPRLFRNLRERRDGRLARKAAVAPLWKGDGASAHIAAQRTHRMRFCKIRVMPIERRVIAMIICITAGLSDILFAVQGPQYCRKTLSGNALRHLHKPAAF
jgi:hypothetical protein